MFCLHWHPTIRQKCPILWGSTHLLISVKVTEWSLNSAWKLKPTKAKLNDVFSLTALNVIYYNVFFHFSFLTWYTAMWENWVYLKLWRPVLECKEYFSSFAKCLHIDTYRKDDLSKPIGRWNTASPARTSVGYNMMF